MRYRADGYIIRSENAARPSNQGSRYLIDLLRDLAPMSRALDYGCGKLRYATHLEQLTRELTLVDSEIQLSRTQVVCGETTTIRAYVMAKWPDVRVINHIDFRDDHARYDFILCANVLSAIPHTRVRMAIVKLLAARLTSRGRCLLVCQYTNSYFRAQLCDSSVKKLADGFIKGSPENASFFGVINPGILKRIAENARMVVEQSWQHGQSSYVIGKRN